MKKFIKSDWVFTDPKNLEGLNFRAKILEVYCEGKIKIEKDEIYLCQNEKEGINCKDRLGYKHSWFIADGSKDKLESANVSELEIEMETGYESTRLQDFHGYSFYCRIYENGCVGKICVEGERVYLCQNENNGSECSDKLGYKYSWCVSNGSPDSLEFNDVESLVILDFKKTTSVFDKEEIEKEILKSVESSNLLDKHGVLFKANIKNRYGKNFFCEGRICVERGCVYLCQNEIEGTPCFDKLGYKYSWCVYTGTVAELKNHRVSEFWTLADAGSYSKDPSSGAVVRTSDLPKEVKPSKKVVKEVEELSKITSSGKKQIWKKS